MNKAIRSSEGVRMMTIEQGCEYTGMGKNSFRRWANEIGAVHVFSSRMTRYDRRVIDAALDEIMSEGRKAQNNAAD